MLKIIFAFFCSNYGIAYIVVGCLLAIFAVAFVACVLPETAKRCARTCLDDMDFICWVFTGIVLSALAVCACVVILLWLPIVTVVVLVFLGDKCHQLNMTQQQFSTGSK